MPHHYWKSKTDLSNGPSNRLVHLTIYLTSFKMQFQCGHNPTKSIDCSTGWFKSFWFLLKRCASTIMSWTKCFEAKHQLWSTIKTGHLKCQAMLLLLKYTTTRVMIWLNGAYKLCYGWSHIDHVLFFSVSFVEGSLINRDSNAMLVGGSMEGKLFP